MEFRQRADKMNELKSKQYGIFLKACFSCIVLATMVRVQVFLERETLDKLKSKAQENKKSISEIIREMVMKDLERNSPKKISAIKDLLRMSKQSTGMSGISDLSSNDDYLYRLP